MKFTYEVLNNNTGKKEKGSIDAPDMAQAGRELREKGLTPTNIIPEGRGSFTESLRDLKSISLKEKIVFIEDLAIMLKSGIGVSKGLNIITSQNKNGKFHKILKDISGAVESGTPLNAAMAKYPKVFSNIFVSMVKVGEVSGNLDKSLNYLAVQLEREADLKSKTKGAMMYPAVILSAMLIIGVLMSVFVLPKLTVIFKEFQGGLPLTTRIIVGFAEFMSGHAILVIGGLILAIIGFIAFLRTKPGQTTFDWFLLHFPATKEIVKKINIARFSRIFSSLLKSGINVVEGLAVAGEALGNVYYRDVLIEASSEVKLGKPITAVFEQNEHLFPNIIVEMLKVGEETGSMESILEQIAIHYEEEVDTTMKNISSIIEPLLLLIIGAVVGFLALGLISPIYNISQSIQ